MSPLNKKIAWLCQFIAGPIFIWVGILKLSGNQTDIDLFLTLGMEPAGRIIIGIVELFAGLLIISDAFAALGALLGVAVMIGAIIAHATRLGFSIGGDGGVHILMLLLVFSTSLSILIIRRQQLPFIGPTL